MVDFYFSEEALMAQSVAEVGKAGDGNEVVPETEGQQQDPTAAVGKTGGGDEVVPRIKGQQLEAAACRGNGDGLEGRAGGNDTAIRKIRG